MQQTGIDSRRGGGAPASFTAPQASSAGMGWFPDLREAWAYRDLFVLLVRRDLVARYKQTALGWLWAPLQPLLLGAVYAVFLGLIARVPSEPGVPYPVFAVSGMVLWLFFAGALSTASVSTTTNAPLITKVYFPRVLIPVAAVVPPMFDFVLALSVVIGAMLIFGVSLSPMLLLMPLVMLLAAGTALGAGLWLSALQVKFRDVEQVVPFALLVGLFVTPIIYPFSLIPDSLQPFYALNPMVGVLEGYRWLLFPDAYGASPVLLVPLAAGILLLVTGAAYFRRTEHTFADVI